MFRGEPRVCSGAMRGRSSGAGAGSWLRWAAGGGLALLLACPAPVYAQAPVIVSAPVEREVVFVFPAGAVRCAFFMAGSGTDPLSLRSERPVFELVPGQRCGWLPKPGGADGWGGRVELRCADGAGEWSPVATRGGVPAQIDAYAYQAGDANEDGELDVLDATVIRRRLAGLP